MEMPGESALLEKCPRCKYLLTGLPIEHYCPECGLTIDRRWRVFGGKPFHKGPWRMLAYAGYALLSAYVVTVLITSIQERRPSILLVLPMIALAIAYSRRIPLGFLAVGPRGLAIYRGRGQIEEFRWHRVGKARYDIRRKSICVAIDGAVVRLRGYPFFRGDVFEADSCVRCINSFPRDHGAEQRSGSKSLPTPAV
jgi:hypothetical protein